MTEEMLLEQTSCHDRDLYTILNLAKYNLNQVDSPYTKKALKKIIDEVTLVKEHGVGEGVYVYLKDTKSIASSISYSYAEYYYSTDNDDHAVAYSLSYEKAIVGLLGLMKDGVIQNIGLYKRRNWNVRTGDPLLDADTIGYKVKDKVFEVEDKDALARMLDVHYKGCTVEEYIDLISSASIITDESHTCDNPILQVVVQDRLDGRVIGKQFSTLESSIDFIINNCLLEMFYLNQGENNNNEQED